MKLSKRAAEYLHAVDDWKAAYEVANTVFRYGDPNLVKPYLGRLIGRGLVTYSGANATYRITEKGRDALRALSEPRP